MFDAHAQLNLHHQTATERQISQEQRIALETQRARRIQRWADWLGKVSNRLSRTARTRLARLP